MSARVHTQASNRAQPKKKKRERPTEQDPARKVVFKSVLDNPLVVKWPDVPMNVQNAVLAALSRLLEGSGVGSYHEERERRSRKLKSNGKGKAVESATSSASTPSSTTLKRKASQEVVGPFKKRRLSREARNAPQPTPLAPESEVLPTITTHARTVPEPLVPPDILSNMTFGINEVTKRLEAQIQSYRRPPLPQSNSATQASSEELKSKPPLRFIFACTQDVNPPSLIEHLPILVATCNASRSRSHPDADIVLVPLPKNAEGNLTEAVKLRRTAVLALDASTPGMDGLEQFSASLPVLFAPWLVSRDTGAITQGVHPPALIPTHVKQLRTTAPKDMRATKEQRAKGRAEAKLKGKRGGGGGGGGATVQPKASEKEVVP